MDISKYGMTIENTNEFVSHKVTPKLDFVKIEAQDGETFSTSNSGFTTDPPFMNHHDDIIGKHIKIERDHEIDIIYEDIKREIVDENEVTDGIPVHNKTQDVKSDSVKIKAHKVETFSESNSGFTTDPPSMNYHDDIIGKHIKIERDDEIDVFCEDIKTEIVDENKVTDGIPDHDMTQDVKLLQSNAFEVQERRHTEESSNSFTRKSVLEVHERIHTGEQPFWYGICLKSSAHVGSLKVHKKSHAAEKPFQCTLCSKSFAQSTHLKVHERSHTGERPFHCEVCSKSFTHIGNLKVHRRSHTGEKPFMCVICSKYFAQKIHLRVHKRSHTGEKPFQCRVCLKSFAQSHTLKNHERTHTGEKPFKCTICSKSFTQQSNLKVHEGTHARRESCRKRVHK